MADTQHLEIRLYSRSTTDAVRLRDEINLDLGEEAKDEVLSCGMQGDGRGDAEVAFQVVQLALAGIQSLAALAFLIDCYTTNNPRDSVEIAILATGKRLTIPPAKSHKWIEKRLREAFGLKRVIRVTS